MQQQPYHLDYRADVPPRSRALWWYSLALLVVGAAIIGLRKLATMPYRPPYDMSTFLGGPELAIVNALTMVLIVIWCALLVGFTIRLRQRPDN